MNIKVYIISIVIFLVLAADFRLCGNKHLWLNDYGLKTIFIPIERSSTSIPSRTKKLLLLKGKLIGNSGASDSKFIAMLRWGSIKDVIRIWMVVELV